MMQTAIDYKYLSFIQRSKIESWSTYALLGKGMQYTQKYPFVKIGDFLTRNKTQVKIQDGIIYKRPTIKMNAKGIRLRNEVDGKTIGTKNQFIIREGQFLLSKIDARNGAFGVVPNELDKGIITGNFWTFDVDYSKINPHYLTLLTGTKEFQKLSQSASVGTTNRNYLQQDSFLNFKIPLPTLTEQETIIRAYQNKIQQAHDLERQAQDLEGEIERYLYDSLEIIKQKNELNKKGLRFIEFKETQRWDTLYLLGKANNLNSKYQNVKFSDILTAFNKNNKGKSIRIDSSKTPDKQFKYIGMEHIEKETGKLLELNDVLGKEIKSQTLNVPIGFFIYGKLRPYLNKYWINNTEHSNIICSSEFFVFDIDIEKADKLFFKYILSSKLIQYQISDKTSGARMPRINETIFYNLQFPLPPLVKQKEIANKINGLKSDIKTNKTKSEILIQQAEQEFEQAIFS